MEAQLVLAIPGALSPDASVFSCPRPLDGSACLSQMHAWAPLQVLHGDADVLFPVSGVGSYGPAGTCLLVTPRPPEPAGASVVGVSKEAWARGRRGPAELRSDGG